MLVQLREQQLSAQTQPINSVNKVATYYIKSLASEKYELRVRQHIFITNKLIISLSALISAHKIKTDSRKGNIMANTTDGSFLEDFAENETSTMVAGRVETQIKMEIKTTFEDSFTGKDGKEISLHLSGKVETEPQRVTPCPLSFGIIK